MTHPVKAQSTQNALAIPEEARKYIAASKSNGTRRAYRSAYRQFERWCRKSGHPALPASPETVAAYLSHLADAGRKVATVSLAAASIAFAHRTAGLESPTRSILVVTTLSGVRRTLGTAQTQKLPLTIKELRNISESLPQNPKAIRDRLVLLLGVAGCLRRGEISQIDAEHIRKTGDGLVLRLPRSKTDAEGAGAEVGIPYGSNRSTCPVRAYDAYVEATGIVTGPLFRPISKSGRFLDARLSDKAVSLIVKECVERIGLDPRTRSGHTLRATLPTASALAGVQERIIAQQTRHKSMIVLRKYIRHGNLFRENPASMIGL